MRKFKHASSMSCYQNPFLGILALLVLLVVGGEYGDLSFLKTIVTTEPVVFMIFIFSGCVALTQQVCKIIAARHSTASSLAIYQYLAVPYQITFDMLVIGSNLNIYQLGGISALLLVYVLKIY
jgi:hypothetical protein